MSFKHSNIENTSCYRYIVRSYNKNCRGEWSEGSTFTAGEPPAPLEAPVVTVEKKTDESNSIKITWPEPLAEDKVTGYAIFIGTASGEYKENKQLCDGLS